METADLVKLIANYGSGAVCLAVLIMLHVYNVRVTLPSVAKEASAQINQLVKAFREELSEERRQCHEDHSLLSIETRKNQLILERLSERLRVPSLSEQDVKVIAGQVISG